MQLYKRYCAITILYSMFFVFFVRSYEYADIRVLRKTYYQKIGHYEPQVQCDLMEKFDQSIDEISCVNLEQYITKKIYNQSIQKCHEKAFKAGVVSGVVGTALGIAVMILMVKKKYETV